MEAKTQLVRLTRQLSAAEPSEIGAVLSEHLAVQANGAHYFPFPDTVGAEEAAACFWKPLREAFPDYEIRAGLLLEGIYEDRKHASLLGFVAGNHLHPFCGISPTRKLALLRFAMNAIFDGSRITSLFVMFDLVELMRTSGRYPFGIMPGSTAEWLFPPAAGLSAQASEGLDSLAIVREMQHGLPDGPAVVDRASAAAHHSSHWAKTMNWFGPAGIGSSRGMEGFRDSHGALFLKAFPDRSGLPRRATPHFAGEGHFCEIGEGAFAMTAGWPNMRGYHTGAGWLGLPPTGREIRMRVADWYRLDGNHQLADNWVMIDIPHMVDQMGSNLLAELPFIDDPRISRLP
ncbi:MAG: hypothetical protein V2I43_25565 [Parvularcula sp.]|jgi:hypothetical protein|nr:hypothetical protein [Parvularcula sp.]